MKRHHVAAVTLFVTAAAWGATFTLVKNILGRIAPEPVIFLRFTLAGVILMLIALPRGRVSATSSHPGSSSACLSSAAIGCKREV